jgi:N-methylhydantoinase A
MVSGGCTWGLDPQGLNPGQRLMGGAGEEPTTTDANLVLGRINPRFFCGGELEADMKAVHRAMERVGRELGLSVQETARGIVRIANNNMVNALKLVSVNRGYDPRDFTLVAFGGGGGLHAVALARELGMRKVVIPWAADVFSAFGMLMTDLRRDYLLTRLISLHATDASQHLTSMAQELTATALGQLDAEGLVPEQARFLYFGRLRYENQEHTVEIPLPAPPYEKEEVERIAVAFHQAYEREYTYRLEAPVEFVTLHLVAAVAIERLGVPTQPGPGA